MTLPQYLLHKMPTRKQPSKKQATSFTDNKLEVVQILNGITQLCEIVLLQRVFTQHLIFDIH